MLQVYQNFIFFQKKTVPLISSKKNLISIAGHVNSISNPLIQAKNVKTEADKYLEESLDDFRSIKWLLLSMFILLNFLMCIISFLLINL
jgi:hypothetical protein